jgi:hypothetical protein
MSGNPKVQPVGESVPGRIDSYRPGGDSKGVPANTTAVERNAAKHELDAQADASRAAAARAEAAAAVERRSSKTDVCPWLEDEETEIKGEPLESGASAGTGGSGGGGDGGGGGGVTLPAQVQEEEEEDDEVDDDGALTVKERVWNFVDDPGSGTGAKLWAIFILLVIGASCGAYVVETHPAFHRKDVEVWYWIEFVCVVIFSVELCARFFSAPSKAVFLSRKQVMNWIDIMAVVPWYIEQIVVALDPSGETAVLDVFRILRLLRVFRVFRIGKYLTVMQVFIQSLVHSAPALLMLVAIILICCIFFSSLMWLAEHGTYNKEMGE